MQDYTYIAQNIQHVRNAMQQAGASDDTRLMAVTKFVDAQRINYAIDHCHIKLIGENRVQELLDKYDQLHLEGVSVHFIGSLQTNKVKYIIDKVDMIQSLDSLHLAQEIERQAEKHDKRMDCLIEVNIGGEENKGGVLPQNLFPLFEQVQKMPHIRVCGLMTIAPFVTEEDEQYMYFSQTRALFDRLRPMLSTSVSQPVLSMGMSDSLTAAIRAGSNMIRIGTAIFGARS